VFFLWFIKYGYKIAQKYFHNYYGKKGNDSNTCPLLWDYDRLADSLTVNIAAFVAIYEYSRLHPYIG